MCSPYGKTRIEDSLRPLVWDLVRHGESGIETRTAYDGLDGGDDDGHCTWESVTFSLVADRANGLVGAVPSAATPSPSGLARGECAGSEFKSATLPYEAWVWTASLSSR